MIYFKQNKFMKTEEKEREGKRIPDQNLSVVNTFWEYPKVCVNLQTDVR